MDLFTHRSIRKFKQQPVPLELLNKALLAATRASNTGNMQAYSIIVTTDKELLDRLASCHFNQPASQAPVQLTFCADYNRFSRWCQERKASPGFENFLSYVGGMVDAVLASQNFCIAAEAEGLGICYLGTVFYSAEAIIDILNLPKGVVPVATVVTGYPDETPDLTDRLPLEGLVHWQTYKDYTTSDINAIYAEKEALPFTKKLLDINDKETLAQIFTDNRYPREMNERVSASLLQVLRKQGFMD